MAFSAKMLAQAFALGDRHRASLGETLRWLHQGKKTYAVALAIVAYPLAQHVQTGAPIDWTGILNGLGLAALRAGVTKSGPGNGTAPKEAG